MQQIVQLTWVFSTSLSMSCASFSMLDGAGGTGYDPPGPSGIENDEHGIEKLLLKTQVSWTISYIVKLIY